MTTTAATPEAPLSYEPRDPVFYLHAVCLLAAALQPPGPHESDRELAETTARRLAAVLDGGPAPEDFMVPRIARELEELTELGVLLAPTALNPTNPRTVTAGQQASARERAKARGLPIDGKGIEDRKARLLTDHGGLLKRLGDVSEPARFAALSASVTRIAARPDLTGAPQLLTESLGLVVHEIERAVRLAGELKLPTASLGSGDPHESAENVAPYPASITLSIFKAARAAEGEEGTEVVVYSEGELRALLASELGAAGKDKLAALATAPDADLATFAAFVDSTQPGVLSPKLRQALGFEASP